MRIKENNIKVDEICEDKSKVKDCVIKIENTWQLKEEEFNDDVEVIDKVEKKDDFYEDNNEFYNENTVTETEKYENNKEMNVKENRTFLFEDLIDDESLPDEESPIESKS